MDVTLCLTHDCNLGCTYCYAGTKRRRAMTWDTAHQALDFVFAVGDPKIQLGFFGGEPLLEWELLQRCTDEAQRRADDAGVRLVKTVTTNATLMTGERARWLADRGFVPALSIDGNRSMHDATRRLRGGGSSFDACMAGLDASLAVYPDVEVIVVPDPANVVHTMDGVRHLVQDRGVRRVSLNPNFYTPWSDEALDVWREQYHRVGDFYVECYRSGNAIALNFIDGKVITHLKCGFECRDRCNFGEREIAVAPSGRIYPCERLVGDDVDDDPMCIGTVATGFDEARRAAILARRGCTNDECTGCAIRNRCMNWCCCINYTLTGAIDVTDGIVCFHERLAVDVADRVGRVLFEERNPLFLARFYGENFEP